MALDDILTPGGERNAREFKSVVFPAPDEPRIASNSPLLAMPHTIKGRKK